MQGRIVDLLSPARLSLISFSTLPSPGEGAHIARRPRTQFEDTWGLGLKLGTVCEDTWASADTCYAKTVKTRGRLNTLLGAKTRRRPKTLPENTSLAEVLPGSEARGEGTYWSEDTWASEDTSRRIGSRPVTSRRHVRTKALPEDRSGEDTWRSEDMPLAACQRAPVVNGRGVKSSRGVMAPCVVNDVAS